MFDEWLEWGQSTIQTAHTEIKKGSNVEINGDKGDFCGEWQMKKLQDLPNGRGILTCKDKWILGYAENRTWAVGSWQVVIFKEKNLFKVFRVEIARPGGL